MRSRRTRSPRDRRYGIFHVGGRIVEISGKPVKEVTFTPGGTPAKVDPNGKYLRRVDVVQHFTPKTQRASLPILMWHGGGLSGVTYETTPDGREGWQTLFLRKGFKVYTLGRVERGRSGFASPDVWTRRPGFPAGRQSWERFRIGPGGAAGTMTRPSASSLGRQPVPGRRLREFRPEVSYPRWTTTARRSSPPISALVDKVCPCIVLVHSQAGQFGQRVAQARPDKVKAQHPGGAGRHRRSAQVRSSRTCRSWRSMATTSSRMPAGPDPEAAERLQCKVVEAGGKVDVIHLPERGQKAIPTC